MSEELCGGNFLEVNFSQKKSLGMSGEEQSGAGGQRQLYCSTQVLNRVFDQVLQ